MKKLFFILMAILAVTTTANAKTLVAYYSFTNNVHTIATDLQAQTNADMVRIEPAAEGVDYAANGYAIGSALISAIRSNPNDASSYPEIKPLNVNFSDYDMVIVAAPLWWNNMAAPMQTFLFQNGAKMGGKKIGLIVSSASSGISDVVADAHRLIPNGDFVTPNLWIRSSQTQNCHSMIANWLEQIDYADLTSGMGATIASEPTNIRIAADALFVDGDFNSLAIYSISGQKMLESTQRTVSISSLAPGVYVAQISANSQSAAKKFIFAK